MMDSKDDTGNHQIVPSGQRELARRSDALAARGLRDLARCAPDKPPTLTLDCGGGVQMELVLIPAGTFTMGSGEDDEEPAQEDLDDKDFEPTPQAHEVTISKPFYMGRYAVTQEQWQAVMGSNPNLHEGAKNPVDSVSWNDCQEFLEELKKKYPQLRPALPTEAQWEYACRAGGTGEFCFGDHESELSEYAWFTNNAAYQTHPVGQKRANAWGFYDMHGNVWEWCADWFGRYSSNSKTDPTGAASGRSRVIRGGACSFGAAGCRSSYRFADPPDFRSGDRGFRLVLDPN